MKNFAQFNAWVQDQKEEDWHAFFRKTIALTILWNAAERIVRRQKYGGYTHAIVAYTLAWLHHLTDLRIDLDLIWSKQMLDEVFPDSIELLSALVNEYIRDTELNVTEWCKKDECWNGLLNLQAPSLPDFSSALLSGNNHKRYDAAPSSELENINFCKEKGADSWFSLSKWLKDRGFMQGKQRSQCFNMGRTLNNKQKEPSAVLSAACRTIWEKAVEGYGWEP